MNSERRRAAEAVDRVAHALGREAERQRDGREQRAERPAAQRSAERGSSRDGAGSRRDATVELLLEPAQLGHRPARRTSTRARCGASWRVARSWPSTASVSISMRRPKRCSGRMSWWRIVAEVAGARVGRLDHHARRDLRRQLQLLVGRVPADRVLHVRQQRPPASTRSGCGRKPAAASSACSAVGVALDRRRAGRPARSRRPRAPSA